MTTERDELLKEEREEPKHETFGLSLMALAALFFAVQSFLVRYVTAYGTLPVSTVVLVRGITQTILGLLTTAIVPDGRDVFNNTPRLWWLLAFRGFAGAVAIVALFLSFSMVPLSVASSLYYTNPVWVLIYGAFALHERVCPRIALAAFISLVGAVLVTDPFSHKVQNLLGVGLALAAAIIAALAYTTLRAIATQVRFLASVLSFGVFTTIAGLVCGGVGDLFSSWSDIGIAIAASICAFGAQCSISKGYEYCTAGKGALVRNLELPLAYLLGIAFLNEVPNLISTFGGVLILFATLIIGYEAIRNERSLVDE